MTAKALLDAKPNATREEVAEALSGNLCRCTGYQAIHAAVQAAGAKIVDRRDGGGS
jgi:carbon-monoxide dehydrogenase small subunit